MIAAREASGEAGAPRALAFRLLSDERLARLAEGGSDPAFAAIYGRYSAVLQGYCRSIVRDEDEARDALQNAMLKALQAMRRQGRSAPLRPWLFRIAHNESISLLRSRSRRGEQLDTQFAGGPDAHRAVEAREQLAELLDDLGSLTGHQRGALVMRELGGLGYDEIATALDTSPLAARQAVFTARRNLVALGDARGRPHGSLTMLIPPAPAGAALLGAILTAAGGSAGGSAVLSKTAAIVASVSVAFGTIEIANQTLLPDDSKRDAAGVSAAQASERPAAKRHAAVSPHGARTATRAVAASGARAATVASAAAAAAAAQQRAARAAQTGAQERHSDATRSAGRELAAADEFGDDRARDHSAREDDWADEEGLAPDEAQGGGGDDGPRPDRGRRDGPSRHAPSDYDEGEVAGDQPGEYLDTAPHQPPAGAPDGERGPSDGGPPANPAPP